LVLKGYKDVAPTALGKRKQLPDLEVPKADLCFARASGANVVKKSEQEQAEKAESEFALLCCLCYLRFNCIASD
jgi:hypothetical protein